MITRRRSCTVSRLVSIDLRGQLPERLQQARARG